MELVKDQIEKQELQSLQDLNEKLANLFNEIGKAEVRKHYLMHNYKVVNDEFAELRKTLKEKYGDVAIDIATGAITKEESNEHNSEN
jgi:predicted transcriptional regulator